MKKFFTLFTGSLFSLSLFAFDGSRLNISAISCNMNLKIELDGQQVRLLGNSITLNNLNEGKHNFRVYRAKKNYNLKNRFDPGYEIMYATSVYLNRSYEVDITIDGAGKVYVDTYRIDTEDEYYKVENNGYDDKTGFYKADGFGVNNGYNNIMNPVEFSQLIEQIRKERFDANRMISVKTVIDKNNFTAKQVKEMMSLFTIESNRQDVAKYAYHKTLDKENYYKLNDIFSYSSSKDELACFIRESR